MTQQEVEVLCLACDSWFLTTVDLGDHGSFEVWQLDGDLCECPSCFTLTMTAPENTHLPVDEPGQSEMPDAIRAFPMRPPAT